MAIRTTDNPSGVSTQSYSGSSAVNAPRQKDTPVQNNELSFTEPSASVTTSTLANAGQGLAKIAGHKGNQRSLSKLFQKQSDLSSSSPSGASEPSAQEIVTDKGIAHLLADATGANAKASNRAGELDLKSLPNAAVLEGLAKLFGDLDSIG